MTTTAVRRTALAASAAALALLVTACGGSSDDGEGDDRASTAPSPTPSASASATGSATPSPENQRTHSSAELDMRALTQSDLDGITVTEVVKVDDATRDEVTAEDAACLPLALAQSGVAQADPAAAVKRSWASAPKEPSGKEQGGDPTERMYGMSKGLLTLSSYQGDGATKAVDALRKSFEACKDGFVFTAKGQRTRIDKVVPGDVAPAGADETVALTLTLDPEKGSSFPVKVIVTRKGSTLAAFAELNLGAAATGKDFPFPEDVAGAQVTKLG
ncbi:MULTISPECIES: hypothetical protein [unclassified Streptomyces]|uniref:hypothetical protein n=1 Tax=unclassified Streptomyces TaxID=2593676 RepID=UPI0022386676|nr:hypothetical protein [Streptomyces sp. SHP 1-2]MCW5251523.1 hypothetical protein [Streptomyces sp. SHP 1-2]